MAIVAKRLADGLLPSSKATLYTVPVGTTTYLKGIILHNSSVSSVTATLYLFNSGNSRIITSITMGAGETFYFNESVILGAGNLLEGAAGTSSVIHYWASGAEES